MAAMAVPATLGLDPTVAPRILPFIFSHCKPIEAPVQESYNLAAQAAFRLLKNIKFLPMNVWFGQLILLPDFSLGAKKKLAPWKNYMDVIEVKT
ncbi:hypothetical protein V6N12_060093 [Hibiscus sabdariffa]|uniref:Uncharacterized protein n=1 Tax=Hibiscus sabdariffa TaxID=183260 RepID=A0ABR2D3F3_9ROSI